MLHVWNIYLHDVGKYSSNVKCKMEHLGNAKVNDIKNNFGTLYVTTYSLLRSMLGGINWGILCDLTVEVETPVQWVSGKVRI